MDTLSFKGHTSPFYMVQLEGGRFLMGDAPSGKDVGQRSFSLSPFAISVYEITLKQYNALFTDQLLSVNSQLDTVTRHSLLYLDLSLGRGNKGFPASSSIRKSPCRHIANTMSQLDELLIGTKDKIWAGAGRFSSHRSDTLYAFDRKQENYPHPTEHDELLDAIAKGEFRFADSAPAAQSTFTAMMGRLAIYSGQELDRDKLHAKPINLMPERLEWAALPKVLPIAGRYYRVAQPGTTRYV